MRPQIILAAGALALMPLTACVSVDIAADAADINMGKEIGAVRAVLDAQQQAWNSGDIDGFMEGYWQSPDLRFGSGGSITYGWQETSDRYHKNYSDRAKMGTLDFSVQVSFNSSSTKSWIKSVTSCCENSKGDWQIKTEICEET